MAQPLETRITAALRDSSRLKDVETTISDVTREIASTQKRCDQQTARSIDPALTTPQAREARNNAADLEHDVRRLNASLDLLKARHQAILDDESYARRVARYDAAEKERDDLVQIIRERYPLIVLELLDLVNRIVANDAECQAVNRDRPRDKPGLASSEVIGRDVPANFYWANGAGPVIRLENMTLPLPFTDACALPFTSGLESPLRRDEQIAALRARMLGRSIREAGDAIVKREAADA